MFKRALEAFPGASLQAPNSRATMEVAPAEHVDLQSMTEMRETPRGSSYRKIYQNSRAAKQRRRPWRRPIPGPDCNHRTKSRRPNTESPTTDSFINTVLNPQIASAAIHTSRGRRRNR